MSIGIAYNPCKNCKEMDKCSICELTYYRKGYIKSPTADVVEVVRCKDCVSSRPLNRNDRFEARYSDGCIYCMRTDEGVAKDDYCSRGERREK